MTGVLPVDQNTEGRIWPRIGSHDGGRYLDIPLHHRVRGFTTVQGTGCGTTCFSRPGPSCAARGVRRAATRAQHEEH